MSNGLKIVGWLLTGLGALVGIGSAVISEKKNEAYIDKQIADRESEYINKQIETQLEKKKM